MKRRDIICTLGKVVAASPQRMEDHNADVALLSFALIMSEIVRFWVCSDPWHSCQLYQRLPVHDEKCTLRDQLRIWQVLPLQRWRPRLKPIGGHNLLFDTKNKGTITDLLLEPRGFEIGLCVFDGEIPNPQESFASIYSAGVVHGRVEGLSGSHSLFAFGSSTYGHWRMDVHVLWTHQTTKRIKSNCYLLPGMKSCVGNGGSFKTINPLITRLSQARSFI